MKKYISISFVLLLLTLLSCGTRQTSLQKNKESSDSETAIDNKTEIISNTETTSQASYKISDNFLNFAIKPIDGLPAKFSFIHNGEKIEGETSGELNFTNQKKEEVGKVLSKTIVNTIYRIHNVYRIHKIHRTESKQRETKSKRPSWWLYGLIAVLSILLWEAAKSRFKFL